MLDSGPHKNWMCAMCRRGFEYYFYLEKGDASTIICGPHWTGLCEAYLIRIGDYVKFTYNKRLGLFDVQVTDAKTAVKFFVQLPGTLATRFVLSLSLIFHQHM